MPENSLSCCVCCPRITSYSILRSVHHNHMALSKRWRGRLSDCKGSGGTLGGRMGRRSAAPRGFLPQGGRLAYSSIMPYHAGTFSPFPLLALRNNLRSFFLLSLCPSVADFFCQNLVRAKKRHKRHNHLIFSFSPFPLFSSSSRSPYPTSLPGSLSSPCIFLWHP